MSLFDRTMEGRRIELIDTDDPYTKLRPGDQGTIRYTFMNLDSMIIQVEWDSGSNLGLILGKDSFKLLPMERKQKEEITK